jgi:DNA-binding NtrC family response regulator
MKSKSDFSIFLVDDDPFFLNICEKYLINLGFSKISKFESSTVFLNNLHQQPDLILLDYSMDSLNGIETLKKIKRFNPDSLVIFISGQENIDIAVNALKYGAFDYLIKKQISEEKLSGLIDKGIAVSDLISKKSRKNIIRRLLPFMNFLSLPLLLHQIFH